MLQLISLTALLMVVPFASGAGTCDSTKFRGCTKAMEDFLHITDDAIPTIWNDAAVFADKLEQLFISKSGDMMNVAKICNGLEGFYSCLGADMIKACLGVPGLVSLGIDPPSASAFMGILKRWRFQCGAAFYGMKYTGTLECIQQTLRSLSPKLVNATKAYMANILHDPVQACKYANTLMKTYGTAFSTHACLTTDSNFGRWFGCEGAKEYTLGQFRHCETVNLCPYGKIPSADDSEYVKMANGVTMVKIMATWVQDAAGRWYIEPEKWI